MRPLLLLVGFVSQAALCGWVDPDSPESVLEVRSLVDDAKVSLVFSDEFEVSGRRFDDGLDPRWTAIHKNDYTNAALHYYHKDYARTRNGSLELTTAAVKTNFESRQVKHGKVRTSSLTKHFRSGMVQSWNKFCFSGGVLEVRAKLPGRWDIGGLWPAAWLMGNLARSTYVASSEYIWPWSYDRCDRQKQRLQEISACEPSPHFGLVEQMGRGAPEIDLLEVMPGTGWLPWGMTKPYVSTSLQIAPGKDGKRPNNGDRPHKGMWYDGITYGGNSSINVFFYGLKLDHHDDTSYQADALSANTPIHSDFFESFHTYRLEWEPRHYIKWYADDKFLYGIYDDSLRDLTGSHIPDEPSYILLNTALSTTWGFPIPCPQGCKCDCHDCANPECSCGMQPGFCDSLPAHYLVDYVRVYQRSEHKVGCSTDTHPTKKFIEAHKERYSDPDVPNAKPLERVRTGGAYCQIDADCGTSGLCTTSWLKPRSKVCVCSDGATGPTCLAAAAFDDVDYDADSFVYLPLGNLYFPPAVDRLCFAILALVVFIITAHFARLKLPTSALLND